MHNIKILPFLYAIRNKYNSLFSYTERTVYIIYDMMKYWRSKKKANECNDIGDKTLL